MNKTKNTFKLRELFLDNSRNCKQLIYKLRIRSKPTFDSQWVEIFDFVGSRR